MPLPTYIEKILTLNVPNSDEPGALVQQTAAQYVYPIIPPNTTVYFITSLPLSAAVVRARGFNDLFAIINFRIRLGKMPPGIFQLTLRAGGGTAFSGTLPGEFEIDFFAVNSPNRSISAYITNITDANQRFEMWNEYLIIPTVAHWQWLKASLKKMNFPYELPDYGDAK
jgi:hypothetical protein